MSEPLGTLFELELLGGPSERRYRKMRPEVEAMPWGTLDISEIPADRLISARKAWTLAAYQEHRTGAACAATLKALMETQAPLDLIAMASRFPLDELVHVELCARMAMELGGGTEVRYHPDRMIVDADPTRSDLERAADVVVRFFCVGEALSIPLLRGTWKAAQHPLPRAVLGRIVKDEAAHGVFGYWFLDWALPHLRPDSLKYLADRANLAIDGIAENWKHIAAAPRDMHSISDPLSWMETGAYLDLATRSMKSQVVDPLRERGVPVKDVPLIQ
jgi:hypothetical protein